MIPFLSILGCSLLFVAYGLLARRSGRGEGCSSCTTSCPVKETRHGHP